MPALDALRAHAADASLDGDGHAAACEACKELGIRHLRVGSGPSSYDTSQEPICARLSGTAPVVYQAGADPAAAIAGWCGC